MIDPRNYEQMDVQFKQKSFIYFSMLISAKSDKTSRVPGPNEGHNYQSTLFEDTEKAVGHL